MLQIVVQVAGSGTVCGAGFAVFFRTVDRLPPVTADRNPAGLMGRPAGFRYFGTVGTALGLYLFSNLPVYCSHGSVN